MVITFFNILNKQPILTFCFKNMLPYFGSRCWETLPTYTAHSRAQAVLAFNVRYQTWGGNEMPWKLHLENHVHTSLLRLLLIGCPRELQSKTDWWHMASKLVEACSLSLCPVVCPPSLWHTHARKPLRLSLSLLKGTHTRKQTCRTKTMLLSSSVLCCFDECSDVFPTAPSEVSRPHTHTHSWGSTGQVGQVFFH